MSSDPLPSWNDGAAKTRIIDFVKRITREATSDFVPEADRIATFDNDGTLWPEQPICIQFVFAFDRLKSLAHVHPELRILEPFQTVIEGGLNVLVTLDDDVIIEILKATQSGMSTEQFSKIVAEWLAVAKDPRFGRVYTRLGPESWVFFVKPSIGGGSGGSPEVGA